MVRASEKVRAKKIMPRACPSFQKAWLDRAELLKTPGSRAQIRAEPRLDPALKIRQISAIEQTLRTTYRKVVNVSDHSVLYALITGIFPYSWQKVLENITSG